MKLTSLYFEKYYKGVSGYRFSDDPCDAAFLRGGTGKRIIVFDSTHPTNRLIDITTIKTPLKGSRYGSELKRQGINLEKEKVITLSIRDIKNKLGGIPVTLEENTLYANLIGGVTSPLFPLRVKPYDFLNKFNRWCTNIKDIEAFLQRRKSKEFMEFLGTFGNKKITMPALTLNTFKFFKKSVENFEGDDIKIDINRIAEMIQGAINFLYKKPKPWNKERFYVPTVHNNIGYIGISLNDHRMSLTFFNNVVSTNFTRNRKGTPIPVEILDEKRMITIRRKFAKLLTYFDNMGWYDKIIAELERKKLLGYEW